MKFCRFVRALLLTAGIFTDGGVLLAQNSQGAAVDNYNPANGQYINPTHIVDSKVWLDINIAGVNAYVYNNYFYYPKTTLFRFADFQNEPEYDTTNSILNAWENALVTGPSFSLVLGKSSVSFFTAARVVSNIVNVPSVLPKSSTQMGLNYADTGYYSIEKARGKAMGWAEAGITYGRIMKAEGDVMWTGAVSAKFLFGGTGASVYIKEGLLYVPNPDTLSILSNSGTFSYAEPDINAGKGFGVNIGVTYNKMKENVENYQPLLINDQCRAIDYRYKIGLSLIDIGFLNFKKNAYFGKLDDISYLDTIQNQDELLNLIKEQAEGYKFTATLPMAFSIQADYNINDQFYVNALLIQRFPTGKTYGPEGINVLSISGRFESKFIGVGLPLSLVNYEQFGLGLSLRLAVLTIGTDNILPWLFKQDVDNASVYASLKINIYKSPPCRDKKNKKKPLTNACAEWK